MRGDMVLLKMTASASVLIAAIALVRAVCLHRLPKGLLSALWLLPLARLLVPCFPAASFSLAALLGLGGRGVPSGGMPTPAVPPSQSSAVLPPAALAPVEVTPGLTGVWSVLVFLWAVGAVVLAVVILGRHLLLIREYRQAAAIYHPNLARWQRENPLLRRVEVRQSAAIRSPLTYGVWRPVILLPAAMDLNQEAKLRCMLAHEYQHIRRWDTLTKWLLAAALCLHWFNPLVWWMHRKASLDMELACDAGVLRTLGIGTRGPYAALLLELEEEKAALALASGLGHNATEERMIAMLRQKKPHPLTGTLILILVLALTGMVATGAPAQPQVPSPATGAANPAERPQGKAAVPPKERQAEKGPDAGMEGQTPPPTMVFTPEEEALIGQFITQGEALPRWYESREIFYKLATGTPVPAPVAGEVEEICDWAKWPFGRQVTIRTEDGARLVVAHLSAVLVEVGDRVEPGDPIGEAGSSGAITGEGYGIYLREDQAA